MYRNSAQFSNYVIAFIPSVLQFDFAFTASTIVWLFCFYLIGTNRAHIKICRFPSISRYFTWRYMVFGCYSIPMFILRKWKCTYAWRDENKCILWIKYRIYFGTTAIESSTENWIGWKNCTSMPFVMVNILSKWQMIKREQVHKIHLELYVAKISIFWKQ